MNPLVLVKKTLKLKPKIMLNGYTILCFVLVADPLLTDKDTPSGVLPQTI
jgi:hypothetical protein